MNEHACMLCVYVKFNCACLCVFTAVSLQRVRLGCGCLFVHMCLLSRCVYVCLQGCAKGSITMCAAGGLWSVSAPRAPRTWLDRCVWRPSGLPSGGWLQHNVPIQAWKETSEISQDPCEEGAVIWGHVNLSL